MDGGCLGVVSLVPSPNVIMIVECVDRWMLSAVAPVRSNSFPFVMSVPFLILPNPISRKLCLRISFSVFGFILRMP